MSQQVVTWHGKELERRFGQLERDALAAFADAAAALAQSRVRVDTGFARENTVALYPGDRSLAGALERRLSSKTGQLVWREAAASPPMDEHTAALYCAAIYAVFIEIRFPFLFPAAQAVMNAAPGILREVAARYGFR